MFVATLNNPPNAENYPFDQITLKVNFEILKERAIAVRGYFFAKCH